MSEEQSVEREITVPVAPEEAWELVTERRHLERWLAPEVDIDLRDGGDVRVVGDDGVERTGTVELIDAPSRLRFTWEAEREGPTIVEISHLSRAEREAELVPEGENVDEGAEPASAGSPPTDGTD